MKNFTKYLLKLLLTVILALLPILAIYNTNLKKSENHQIRDNFNCNSILFIGSSHGRDAFNTSIVNSSYNVSAKGYTIDQTYDDLKTSLAKCNTQIKTVIISFSVFSMRAINPTGNGKGVLNLKNEISTFSFFHDTSRKDIVLALKSNLRIGQNNKSAFDHEAKKQFLMHTKTVDTQKKKITHSYLKNIVKLKNKYKFRLIIVTTPFSKPYNKLLSKHQYWKDDVNFIINYADDNDFEYYNYHNYFSNDNSYFKDPSHLNKKGATAFSEYLAQTLKLSN